MRVKRLLVIVITVVGAVIPALTQEYPRYRVAASIFQPLDSWVYPALEQLSALGYVTTAMTGMRPWPRIECARLVEEASDALQKSILEDHRPSELAVRLHAALEREFDFELEVLGGARTRSLRLESVYTRVMSISGRPLTDGYHFGQTIVNDFGRPFAQGANLTTGFSAAVQEGHFAIYVRGEYQHAPGAPALSEAVRTLISKVDQTLIQPAAPFPETNRFQLLDAYLALNFKNWQFSFGKQSLWWGPGLGGSLIFSNNTEPIPMMRLTRVVPFKLPTFLGWLGPARVDSFFGQLSGHRFIETQSGLFGRPVDPQPFLYGLKISFKPTANLEFGFSGTTIYGGPGLPMTFAGLFRSLTDYGGEQGTLGPKDPGDRRSGFDFSYRIPGLRNRLILYADSFAEDEISPIRFPHRSAMNPGIYVPRIPGIPKLDLRVEGAYTDLPDGLLFPGLYYFNVRYLGGYTYKGRLIGHWIGRQGHGVQAWTTYWFSPQNTLQLGWRHGKVSGDFIPGGGTVNDISLHASFRIRPQMNLSTFLQYERWAFPVLSSGARSNFTSSLQLTVHPRIWNKQVDHD